MRMPHSCCSAVAPAANQTQLFMPHHLLLLLLPSPPALLDVHHALLFPQHARRHLHALAAQLAVPNQPEEAPAGNSSVDLGCPLRWPEQRPAGPQTKARKVCERMSDEAPAGHCSIDLSRPPAAAAAATDSASRSCRQSERLAASAAVTGTTASLMPLAYIAAPHS